MSKYTLEITGNDPSEGFTLGIQIANGECPVRGSFRSLHFGFLLFDIMIFEWI